MRYHGAAMTGQTGTTTILTRSAHAGLRMGRLRDLRAFADRELLPVYRHEFQQFIGMVPLVFARDCDRSWRLCGLFGMESGINLLVGPRGGWRGGPLPDYIRHYPFDVAFDGDGSPVVGFHEGSERLSADVEGDNVALFDHLGEPSKYLGTLRKHISIRHASLARAAELGAELEARELLIPWRAEQVPVLAEGRIFHVAMDKLRTSEEPDWILRLHEEHWFDFIYAHMFSLGQLARLVNLKRRQAAETESGGEPMFASSADAGFDFDQ